MNGPNARWSEITAIMNEKGDSIMQADLDRIEQIFSEMPETERSATRPWFYEGMFLIINDPLYKGDIKPSE
jgi:hypothetical protein